MLETEKLRDLFPNLTLIVEGTERSACVFARLERTYTQLYTHPMQGHRKFLGGGGLKILEAKYEAKLEFP